MSRRASPVQRLAWTGAVDWEAFRSGRRKRMSASDSPDASANASPNASARMPPSAPPLASLVMERSLAHVRKCLEAGALYGADGRLRAELLSELAGSGYWGLRVDEQYGGSGASFGEFAPFLTRMSTLAGAVAGLGSVHGCLGAVARLQMFGTDSQKRRLLPPLARGERLSAFAMTEPNAGSDLTALRTVATRDGGDWVVHGEKVFITNLDYGRTVALVCQVDGQPQVLICELPDGPTDGFQLREYGLHALRRSINRGAVFSGLRVPGDNLLESPPGKGWPVIYQGLNQGRVALCANAAGSLRRMLAGLMPWVTFRQTFGVRIGDRQLVRCRVARLAALIVGCDAVVAWTSRLLDDGHRGEVESIVAKVLGAAALREATIDIALKTHGGRSFLHGHAVGDNLHDWMAPSIYEGESDLLSLALLKSLGRRDQFDASVEEKSAVEERDLGGGASRTGTPPFDRFVARASDLAAEIRRELVDWSKRDDDSRQGRGLELSLRVQRLTVLLCVAAYGSDATCETVRLAAEVYCRDLLRELSNDRAGDDDYATADELGRRLMDGADRDLVDLPPEPLLLPYEPL